MIRPMVNPKIATEINMMIIGVFTRKNAKERCENCKGVKALWPVIFLISFATSGKTDVDFNLTKMNEGRLAREGIWLLSIYTLG